MILKSYKHVRTVHVQECVSHTFHSHRVSVCDLPLGVLSYTLILATVSLRDITEAQAAVKHVFSGTRLRQLAVLPQPRHFGSWTVERERGGGGGATEEGNKDRRKRILFESET